MQRTLTVNAKTFRLSIVAASLLASAAAAADSTLVADFEMQTNANNIQGFWFFLNDKPAQGNSEVTSADTTVQPPIFGNGSFDLGHGSMYAAKFAYRLGSTRPACGAGCTFSPEVTMGTNIVPTQPTAPHRNLTGATAISFWAKATPPIKVSIIAISKDVTDYSWPRAEVSVTSEWTRHTAYLAGAQAPVFKGTWGAMKDKNPTLAQMEGFSFAIQKDLNKEVTTGTLWLDDLYIHGWKAPEQTSSLARPSLAKALRSVPEGQGLRVSVPEAYRGIAGVIAAVDLSGRTLGEAAFAKGQASVSLKLPGRAAAAPVFLRVFTGSEPR